MERLLLDRLDSNNLLITESIGPGQNVVKSELGISGILKLRGTLQVAEEVNRNRRLYPRPVLAEAVDRYRDEFVRTKKALCRLDHPSMSSEEAKAPAPSLVTASHAITKITMEGNEVKGEIIVLPTTMGKEYAALLISGIDPGISVRATGSVKPDFNRRINEEVVDIVQPGLRIISFDAVSMPSHATAGAAIVHEAVQRQVISALASGDFDKAYSINEEIADSFYTLFEHLSTVVDIVLNETSGDIIQE